MKWLPRSLWLLAWSLWAWLGWGLYRELPRELEKPLCRLEFDGDESPLGFMAEHQIVSRKEDEQSKSCRIRVYDALTGVRGADWEGPRGLSAYRGALFSSRLGLLIAVGSQPGASVPVTVDRSSVLDIRTGTWADLPSGTGSPREVHPTRPWCLFSSGKDEPTEVGVYDLDARSFLLRYKPYEIATPPRYPRVHPYFLGEDQLGVMVDRINESGVRVSTHEVWSLPQGVRLRAYEELVPGIPASTSRSGARAAWMSGWTSDSGLIWSVDVYDFGEARFLFSKPEGEISRAARMVAGHGTSSHPGVVARMHRTPDGPAGATLSPDGRSILTEAVPEPPKLWDVESGQVLWSGGVEDTAWTLGMTGTFEVSEAWEIPLIGWTWAACYTVRSFQTGRLLHRFKSQPLLFDENGSYGLSGDGHVYSLDSRVNWLLFSVCQTILALPLVLLWAVLRWRRKRRMRLAGAAP